MKTNVIAQLDAIGHDLHAKGWTDPMIARRLGCAKTMVFYWRRRNNLPPNAPRGSPDWLASLTRICRTKSETMKLLELGATPRQAAQVLGITPAAFRKRCKRMGEIQP